MGVTISATKSTYSFDMGYGGLFNLRKNIALALDKELGKNYADILNCHTRDDYKQNDARAEEIISRNNLEESSYDILDFLYGSDCSGKTSYKTCKKIYDLIKDIDFGKKCFRYTAYAHNDYEEFKEFLKECYSHRRNMVWY